MQNLLTSIAYLGDIHGAAHRLLSSVRMLRRARTIIQVGDFGLFPINEHRFIDVLLEIRDERPDVKIIYIDGNHDDHVRRIDYGRRNELIQVFDGLPLWYAPRGSVVSVDGIVHGFLGGAASIDEAYRRKNGFHHDRRENIAPDDIDDFHRNLKEVGPMRVFVTHSPTQTATDVFFPPLNTYYYNLPIGWKDPNFQIVETLVKQYVPDYHICGHMHRHIKHEASRILAIDGLIEVTFDGEQGTECVLHEGEQWL